jgi:glycosyltransferase involved in cell wall biosynthesis
MKVSVLMITYDHEKYIAQAIESVLMQNVNFEYELVVGEHCSTNRTREPVIDYQKRHPREDSHPACGEKHWGHFEDLEIGHYSYWQLARDILDISTN